MGERANDALMCGACFGSYWHKKCASAANQSPQTEREEDEINE